MIPEARPRYRVRTEWNGLEIFDRREGQVHSIGGGYKSTESEPGFQGSEELPDDRETLINTPYEKSPAFASAPRRIYWEHYPAVQPELQILFQSAGNLKGDVLPRHHEDRRIPYTQQACMRLGAPEVSQPVRDDIFDIIYGLSSMGFYLSMGTNGIYSNEILEKVMKSQIDWIILSIDGSASRLMPR